MNSMTFSHYTAGPFTFTPTRIYDQAQSSLFKPHGLWFSVDGDDDLPAWCRCKDFALERLRVRTPIVLTDQTRILHVATTAMLDAFTATYLDPGPYGWINWPRVAEQYDGIIIAPYQWCRRNTSWYYGWDCASGCVWHLQGVRCGPADDTHTPLGGDAACDRSEKEETSHV